MSKKTTLKPVAAVVGAAMITSLAAVSAANADENPFGLTSLSSGYMIAGKEGKCGEGKCGGAKKAEGEGKCGEGKCGGAKKTEGEGKCGEGKCGGAKKSGTEGKCGEGKCGGSK